MTETNSTALLLERKPRKSKHHTRKPGKRHQRNAKIAVIEAVVKANRGRKLSAKLGCAPSTSKSPAWTVAAFTAWLKSVARRKLPLPKTSALTIEKAGTQRSSSCSMDGTQPRPRTSHLRTGRCLLIPSHSRVVPDFDFNCRLPK